MQRLCISGIQFFHTLLEYDVFFHIVNVDGLLASAISETLFKFKDFLLSFVFYLLRFSQTFLSKVFNIVPE